MKRPIKIILLVAGIVVLLLAVFLLFESWYASRYAVAAKPVLYLYPEEETQVSVTLSCDGGMTVSYPPYENGWRVTASPDGTLVNEKDGREYSYLFWEGKTQTEGWDWSQGWCVKGSDTMAFFQETLPRLGLLPGEYNEFIVYWLPLMQENPYNIITFQQEVYTERTPLEIEPEPDSMLRIFMVWQPSREPVEIRPPQIEPFIRQGFVAVEWGGAQMPVGTFPS